MITQSLKEVLQRADTWPAEVQKEVAEIALLVERTFMDGEYVASEAELAAIDEGLTDLDSGRTAPLERIEAILRDFRSA